MAEVRVEALLERTAATIDVTAADRLLDEVIARLPIASAPSRRLAGLRALAYAAAVLAVVLLAVLAWPSGRRAVADFLGIGTARIHVVAELPPSVVRTLDLGTPVDEATAAAVLGRPPRAIEADVGEPLGLYRRGTAISTVYPVSDALPGTTVDGVGGILTEVTGFLRRNMVTKQLPQGTDLQAVNVGGHFGYWIEGAPHGMVLLEVDRDVLSEPLRLAGNVLLWQDGEDTIRLETELDRDAAVALANKVVAPSD
jgi:hypothetical protein